jgi:enoyl-CoA hydratase/carnithine racemase
MGSIDLRITGAIARLTISSPERYNAMSLAMWKRLREVVDGVGADPAVRVVLLRGAGDKAFASGADISEFETQRSDSERVAAYDDAVAGAQQALMDCPKPVVASIRGICMGGGMGLALACDLRYAASSARFRMPAARLGLGYSLNGIRRFVDLIGAARTAELFVTASVLDALEAQRIGVVHKTHEDGEHDAAVEEVLTSIAENAPLTMLAVKLAIGAVLATQGGHDIDRANQAIAACMTSSDYVEGRRAFADKRSPRFDGR